MVYDCCVQCYTWEHFLNLHVDLSLDLSLDFVFVFVCFKFSILCVFIPVSLVVLGLISSVPSQEVGWEERLRNDLFCVEWDAKP